MNSHNGLAMMTTVNTVIGISIISHSSNILVSYIVWLTRLDWSGQLVQKNNIPSSLGKNKTAVNQDFLLMVLQYRLLSTLKYASSIILPQSQDTNIADLQIEHEESNVSLTGNLLTALETMIHRK